MEAQPPFRRGLHLTLALLALAGLLWVAGLHWAGVEWLGGEWPWDRADGLLFHTLNTLPVLLCAWLAFAVFDTHSGVELVKPGWARVGWLVWVLFALQSAAYVGSRIYTPPDMIDELVASYYSFYWDDVTGIGWGYLIAATLISAAGEEVLYRGLLQRAFEGYMSAWSAVVAQALVFEAAHALAYGSGFGHGFHLFAGLIFGIAFMRTRSLMAPFVFHAGGNLIHALLFAPMLSSSS